MNPLHRLRRAQPSDTGAAARSGGAWARRPRPTHALAAAMDVTQGQAATALVALGVAALLALGGLPPVLRRGPAAAATEAAAPAGGAADSAPEAVAPPAAPEAIAAPPDPLDSTVDSFPSASPGSFASPSSPSPSPSPSSSFDSPFDSASPSPDGGASGGDTTGGAATGTLFAGVAGADGIAAGRDRVYVAANEAGKPSKILALRPDGTTARTYDVTGQPAGRSRGVTGLVLLGNDRLLALDASTGRILSIDLSSGAQRTYSELADLPACALVVAANAGCEAGVSDDRPAPAAGALGADGTLFVTDATQGAVWRIPSGGGRAEVLTSDLALAGGNGATGIAVAADGSLLVSSPEAVDPQAAGGGALYRITTAGARSLVARFPRGEAPAGVALVPGGGILVALRGAGALVLLDASGAEVRRATGEVGDVTLTQPIAVVLREGTVLVSDRAGILALPIP